MRRKIRVLVVDDDVVDRRLIGKAISADPDLELAGTAPNGRVGLAKIRRLHPDLVTLDVEMRVMDGLETITAIRGEYPHLPVLMLSRLTGPGTPATMEALLRGANDYVVKPTGMGGATVTAEQVGAALLPKIKTLGALHGLGWCVDGSPAASRPGSRIPASPSDRVDIVAIGVSTGGPNALERLLPRLPADLPVPVLIVQHMPRSFTRLLAERLDARAPLSVAEGVAGGPVTPGRVWLAPGGRHMTVTRNATGVHLALHEGPPENSCRPAADVLFRSVAEAYGPHVLAVVLTGMGLDGVRGAERVRAGGGRVLCQDQASSVVWGMAGAVSRAGLANEVADLDGVPDAILRAVGERAVTAGPEPVPTEAAP